MDFNKISEKWQKEWETKKIFETQEDKKKEKYYVLDMFPYPSGKGLHMGHAFVFTLGDIFARFKRMKGFNVLYPPGYDSLGLPAENAAIKVGTHPEDYTKEAIVNFMKQQKAMGWSYDWSRLIKTSSPDFYKWDQWIFLKMLEKGIAYKKKSPVNWCSECNTVLANEQVENGKCWRHEDTEVEIKNLEQWFFKTRDYAEKLLEGHAKLNWPERAKLMQKNWIGKSKGTEILFDVNGEKWPIFTTRPDTLFGVTFLVISAQHSRLYELTTEKQKKSIEKFVSKIHSVSEEELDKLGKEGVFTGTYAIHPITNEKIPIYAGNFVLADYGSGMVMAVPAHDQRDFDFAKKYKIPIKRVIFSKNELKQAYVGEGKLVDSGNFVGIESKEARKKITEYLKNKKLGKETTQYKLRDWLVSRQRYWGTPIPIVYCDKCGTVPVPEKDLPVKLPHDVKFGKDNPLKTNKEFLNVKCPKCNGKATRETDTMDTFVNSSWYFLRYTDPKNTKKLFDSEKANYWCPIDQYIGGPEHITAHLMYARFMTKVLNDLKLIDFDEPAKKYFTQGLVLGNDGERMSKSKGKVVEPLDTIKKYGPDALRLFLVSSASPDKNRDWDEKGIESTFKFLNRVQEYIKTVKVGKSTPRTQHRINSAIGQIEEDIQNFNYHTATIKLRTLFDKLESEISKKDLESIIKLFAPLCPHLAEEFWEIIGNKPFISTESWPKINKAKINEKFEKEEQLTDKVVSDIVNILNLIESKPKKVYMYVLPNDAEFYNLEDIKKRTNKEVILYKVNDKDKYDPENKSKKAKPGKPAIFLE